MTGLYTFDSLNATLQKIKEDKRDFGGVSIIAIGDLFQLPPVNGRLLWEMGIPKVQNRIKRIHKDNQKNKLPKGNQFEGNPLAENVWFRFKFFELQEIMRQKDEKDWAEFLNRLREYPLTDEDKNYIKEQIIPRDSPIKHDASYITLTNERAKQINNAWFKMAPAENRLIIKAKNIFHEMENVSNADILESMTRCDTNNPQLVQNLPPELELAFDHEYDFIKNLDTLDGLTNGTPCFFKMYQKESSKGDLVWVDPQDAKVGKAWKQMYQSLYAEGNNNVDKRLYPDGIPRTWLPVPRTSLKTSLHFTRSQFPLRPAKARTVNRTQGATMQKIVVDFSGTYKGPEHCHYVAYSRCPKKSNVFILGEDGFAAKKIRHKYECVIEMARLRTKCILSLSLPCLFNMQNEYNSIMFLNAQSACRKFQALENDWNVKGSVVFGIADTQFEEGRERHMSSFSAPEVFASNNEHLNLGLAVYSKLNYNKNMVKHFATQGVTKATLISLTYDKFFVSNDRNININVSFVYVLPNSSNRIYVELASFINSMMIDNTKIIILGDFNRSPEKMNECFAKHLIDSKIKQQIRHPTHNQNSILDQIYTNVDVKGIKCGILDSLTKTDHRPVYISIKKKF